jgi:hypothetical protein
MIKNIKIDGTGDALNINTAILGFFTALDAHTIPATETLTIFLVDVGEYEVEYLSYYVSRLVQTKITIVAPANRWQQAIIKMTDPVWLEWNTPLVGSYLNLEIKGCVLEAHGTLLRNHDQDVSIMNCPATGVGTLAESENGQITLDHVLGSPLGLIISGDPLTAARGVDGGDLTIDRPALVMTYSRLGVLQSNKPVQITNCYNCHAKNLGLNRYVETASYGLGVIPFTDIRKIGSLLDGVAINFGGQTQPLMTLVDGGLYRRVIITTEPTDIVAADYALILVSDPQLHMVCIDRCQLSGAPFGIKIQGGFGVINVTNNIFKNIGIAKVRSESCPSSNRVVMYGNRGDAVSLINGCASDCGPV